MHIFFRVMSVVILSTISVCSLASTLTENIGITDAYVREVIPGNTVTSAYMTITNKSDNTLKLVGVESDIIPRIEIHKHMISDGMMKMRSQSYIDIEARKTVVLQPMGLHLMMFELPEPLKSGQSIHITLVFENGIKKIVKLPVRGIK